MSHFLCVPDAQRAGVNTPENTDEYVHEVCRECKTKRVVFRIDTPTVLSQTPTQTQKPVPATATAGDPNNNVCEACE